MTTTEPEEPQAPPEDAWAAYAAALAVAVAAAVVAAGRIFDRIVPPGTLVEDLAPEMRDVLVAAVARVVAVTRSRAAVLASVRAAAWIGEHRQGPSPAPTIPPAVDLDGLVRAAQAAVDAAEALRVGQADADLAQARRDLAEADRQALRDAEAEAELIAADLAAEDAADRAEAEQEARQAAADVAAEDAAERERVEREARAEQARETRRKAQRRRVEALARTEAAAAAAEALEAPLAAAPEAAFWIRRLDADPCDRCVAWWRSGGVRRGPTPARPWEIRMKRHRGDQCTQVPITREEATYRGIEYRPERAPRAAQHRSTGPRPPDAPGDPGAGPGDPAGAA